MLRILLVDDDDMVREVGSLLLKSMGHLVIDATSAAFALQTLRLDPTFDVLLTDVMMPGALNGLDLALAAVTEFPQLRIIVVSGNLDQKLVASHSHLGIVFLQKPYRRSQLASALTAA